jgi:hypothetical protein
VPERGLCVCVCVCVFCRLFTSPPVSLVVSSPAAAADADALLEDVLEVVEGGYVAENVCVCVCVFVIKFNGGKNRGVCLCVCLEQQ